MIIKNKINFGIIGFGRYAENRLIPAFLKSKHCNLQAISKRKQAAAKEAAATYNIPNYYSDLTKMVIDPDLDVVIICSPPKYHFEHTILSANAGKHVLVEKPIALNTAEVTEMIRICYENNVLMMSGFVMRFIEAIGGGEIQGPARSARLVNASGTDIGRASLDNGMQTATSGFG